MPFHLYWTETKKILSLHLARGLEAVKACGARRKAWHLDPARARSCRRRDQHARSAETTCGRSGGPRRSLASGGVERRRSASLSPAWPATKRRAAVTADVIPSGARETLPIPLAPPHLRPRLRAGREQQLPTATGDYFHARTWEDAAQCQMERPVACTDR